MSDEHSGQDENGAKPDSETDSLASRARTAPAIPGEGAEAAVAAAPKQPPPEPPQFEKPKPQEPLSERPRPEKSNAAEAPAPRKKSGLRPLVVTAGLCVLGAAGYYGWTQRDSREALPPELARFAAMVRGYVAPPAVVAPSSAPTGAAAPVEPPAAEAPPEPVQPTTEKALANVTARLAATQATLAQVAERLHAFEAKAVETPTAPASDKALADVTARLAATQAALDQVTARLQAVEGQLAAPKTESRALLAERDAGPSKAGDVSARIVAAQSLLSAIRQGEDYAPILTALQALGGDPARIARLRAGLAAPDASQLAKDFSALAPKILASVVPPAPAAPQAREPRNFGESAIAFLERRAGKLVQIRPAGAPETDGTAARIARIEKDLAGGDLAAALAERAALPAPALAVTADWASNAQARLDAELAAKAELAAALQGLSKSKS